MNRLNQNDMVLNTPLHWACYSGHDVVVQYLLDCGYNIEDSDNCGNRPLHLAACRGHHKVTEVLLANCADITKKNKYSNTPLDLATDEYLINILKQAESQEACKKCKESFSRSKYRCLCQRCHVFFCTNATCIQT